MTNAILIDVQDNKELIARLTNVTDYLFPSKVVERRGFFPIRKDVEVKFDNYRKYKPEVFFTPEELKEYNNYLEFRDKLKNVLTYSKKDLDLGFKLDIQMNLTDAYLDYVIERIMEKEVDSSILEINLYGFYIKLEGNQLYKFNQYKRMYERIQEGYRIINDLQSKEDPYFVKIPVNRNTLPFLDKNKNGLAGKYLYSYTFKKNLRTDKLIQRFLTEFEESDSIEITDLSFNKNYVYLDIVYSEIRQKEVIAIFKHVFDETEGNKVKDYYVMVQVHNMNLSLENEHSYFILEGDCKFNVGDLSILSSEFMGFPLYWLNDGDSYC
ncbi:hypothetical protein ACQUY5_25070 [Bacillus cereus]|uniref:hypothetical protein n=1 Tax=Bacillus cereus TaxID=1396 RepID=UPI003D185501